MKCNEEEVMEVWMKVRREEERKTSKECKTEGAGSGEERGPRSSAFSCNSEDPNNEID